MYVWICVCKYIRNRYVGTHAVHVRVCYEFASNAFRFNSSVYVVPTFHLFHFACNRQIIVFKWKAVYLYKDHNIILFHSDCFISFRPFDDGWNNRWHVWENLLKTIHAIWKYLNSIVIVVIVAECNRFSIFVNNLNIVRTIVHFDCLVFIAQQSLES